jgi:uncharacterized protein YihD (DUF1040 family)
MGQILLNGNYLYGISSYTTIDGKTQAMDDVFFPQNTFHSSFEDSLEVPSEYRKKLPDLEGVGAVRSLLESCTQNAELLQILKKYVAAKTKEEKLTLIHTLLKQWADTSGMKATLRDRVDELVVFTNFIIKDN